MRLCERSTIKDLRSICSYYQSSGIICPDIASRASFERHRFSSVHKATVSCSESVFLRTQYSSSSPGPPPSSSDSMPSIPQSTFRRKQSRTNSAYCASRRGETHPEPSVETIGTDRGRASMPRGVRSISAFNCCALKNDGKEEGSGYPIDVCSRLWAEALPIWSTSDRVCCARASAERPVSPDSRLSV